MYKYDSSLFANCFLLPGPLVAIMDFAVLRLMLMSTLFSLLVILPLSNTLVRWRAHYCPSRVRLNNRSGERQPPVDNEGVIAPAFGYFKIFTRIYKVEGLTGYYKGLGEPRTLISAK